MDNKPNALHPDNMRVFESLVNGRPELVFNDIRRYVAWTDFRMSSLKTRVSYDRRAEPRYMEPLPEDPAGSTLGLWDHIGHLVGNIFPDNVPSDEANTATMNAGGCEIPLADRAQIAERLAALALTRSSLRPEQKVDVLRQTLGCCIALDKLATPRGMFFRKIRLREELGDGLFEEVYEAWLLARIVHRVGAGRYGHFDSYSSQRLWSLYDSIFALRTVGMISRADRRALEKVMLKELNKRDGPFT